MIISVLGDYDASIYQRQCPSSFQKKSGLRIIFDGTTDADAFVILNQVRKKTRITSRRGLILQVNQEPYLPKYFPWQDTIPRNGLRRHGWFRGEFHSSLSNCVLPWHLSKSYQEIASTQVNKKTNLASSIVSNKSIFPGHRMRIDFLELLIAEYQNKIDFYGKGINFLEKKEDGLDSYMYSVALENSAQNGYWTEKIVDCILSEVVPIYYGGELPPAIFPEGSYIKIHEYDIHEFQAVFEKLSRDDYKRRLPYVRLAKKKILDSHHFFPQIANYFKALPHVFSEERTKVTLRPKLTLKQSLRINL